MDRLLLKKQKKRGTIIQLLEKVPFLVNKVFIYQIQNVSVHKSIIAIHEWIETNKFTSPVLVISLKV